MDGTQGYAAVDETRGLLAIPIGADEDARERGDYVSALRRANGVDFGPVVTAIRRLDPTTRQPATASTSSKPATRHS
jgi:hypothetical protein